MPWYERGLRVTGGIFGARQTINAEIAAPNSITNRAVDKLDDIFKHPPTFKPQSELVTPEGLRVKVSQESALEKMNKPMEMRWENRINLRNGDGAKGSGLVYAWRRHGINATPNKSKFTISLDELKSILQRKDVIKSVAKQSPTSDNFIRQVDVGEIIGNIPVQKGGHQTSVITIITDKAGNLVNTFPGTEDFKPNL